MNHKKIQKIQLLLIVILIFSLIALGISILIQIQNTKHVEALDQICTATGSDCLDVQNSEYGKILGIKMVYVGIFAFVVLTLLIISQIIKQNKYLEMLMLAGGIMEGLFGIYLISLQAFVINHYCIYCLIIDSSSIIMAVLMIIYWIKK